MATAEDILRKSRTKKQRKFEPVQRRVWDYLDTENNDATLPPTNKNTLDPIQNEIPKPIKVKVKKILKQTIKEPYIETEKNLKVNSKDLHKENTVTSTKEIAQKKLLTLTGHQKQIMRFITSHIKSRRTAPYIVGIFPHILAVKIKSSLEITRVSLKRLVEKNILIRLKGERGRNGCCKFKAREDVIKTCFTLFNDAPCDINIIENKIEEVEQINL